MIQNKIIFSVLSLLRFNSPSSSPKIFIVCRNFLNPRTPCGVRLSVFARSAFRHKISIHAPRAGCDGITRQLYFFAIISIHAPRAGCDILSCTRMLVSPANFNPRTPCGVRHDNTNRAPPQELFQSTHPVRGATPLVFTSHPSAVDFNPRTPCGVRHEDIAMTLFDLKISIHAPRAGCDQMIAS